MWSRRWHVAWIWHRHIEWLWNWDIHWRGCVRAYGWIFRRIVCREPRIESQQHISRMPLRTPVIERQQVHRMTWTTAEAHHPTRREEIEHRSLRSQRLNCKRLTPFDAPALLEVKPCRAGACSLHLRMNRTITMTVAFASPRSNAKGVLY